jgi:hypothetical protein
MLQRGNAEPLEALSHLAVNLHPAALSSSTHCLALPSHDLLQATESGSDADAAAEGDKPAVGTGHTNRTPGMLQDMRKSKVGGE